MDKFKSDWIDAVINYVEKTQPKCLDLKKKGLDIKEIQVLLKCVPGSQIRELILSENNLHNGMKSLSKVLVSSEVEKLELRHCELTINDILQLMQVLKFTKIMELNVEVNLALPSGFITLDERDEFISYLLESNLKTFSFDFDSFEEADYEPLIKALMSSKITKLHLDTLNRDGLMALVSNLHRSSVTELNLREKFVNEASFDEEILKAFSQAIRKSELKKLNLRNNHLDDDGVDILVKGLVCSGITELQLPSNKISGSNTLGLCLKDTAIQSLNLSENRLRQHGIFLCPNFLKFSSLVKLGIKNCQVGDLFFQKLVRCLKFSKITHLDACMNDLHLPAISDLAKVLKDTNLESVIFARNNVPAEGIILLAEGIKGSKLKHIDLSSCFKAPDANTLIPMFVAKTKDSILKSLIISSNGLKEAGARLLALNLEDSKLTTLDLSSNEIGNGVSDLAEHLKFTCLSYLNLDSCKITDEGVTALAKHLKDTQLIELRLTYNEITCHGAKALAAALKDSKLLRLHVADNEKMNNDGIEALARGAEDTFLTTLEVFDLLYLMRRIIAPKAEFFLVDTVMLRNKVATHCLINTFKQIAPQVGNCNFRFSNNDVACTTDFLHQCLELYWSIIHQPAAVKVLMEDAFILLSSEQIVALMEEEFPKQFCFFIASGVEASLEDHIGLLKRAEDRSLNKIVEYLLLNRPLYMIDKTNGILHPYVYKLLHKYNYSLYNLAVEPDGKTKILNYFTEHGNTDDAADVVRLLRCKRKQ